MSTKSSVCLLSSLAQPTKAVWPSLYCSFSSKFSIKSNISLLGCNQLHVIVFLSSCCFLVPCFLFHLPQFLIIWFLACLLSFLLESFLLALFPASLLSSYSHVVLFLLFPWFHTCLLAFLLVLVSCYVFACYTISCLLSYSLTVVFGKNVIQKSSAIKNL